ncbi:MAG: ribosome-associated translation inhibitor RaiA [Victivallaceae bacterium]|nr:ribosome-associated translation inhibitor RaiA [Victivallaceae bacterium]
MKINVAGRQCEVTPQIRDYVETQVSAAVSDKALLVTSVNVVIERNGNRFSSTVVVNCKYHVLPASVEDFDLAKSFDAALRKVEAQLTTISEKLRSHQAMPLCDSEAKKAAEKAEADK